MYVSNFRDSESGWPREKSRSPSDSHTLKSTHAKGPGSWIIDIGKSDELRTYSLNSYPEILTTEMTRALDRPFFIRITNRSEQKLYLQAFDYKGNVNTELISSLIPADIAGAESRRSHSPKYCLHSLSRRSEDRQPKLSSKSITKSTKGMAKNEDSLAAVLSTYKEILCSPNFFYLGLPGDLSDEAKENYKLAERLAFFLWCSVPDERLLQAASAGELTTPSVLASHVERMLIDEKSSRWVEQFADQWLQTSKLFNVAVDEELLSRSFKESLKDLMRRETLKPSMMYSETAPPR